MKVSKSPWILHYDGPAVTGVILRYWPVRCPDLMWSVLASSIQGIQKHADILMITGGINAQNRSVVEQIYSQMPSPKVVVAVGICACNGGVFKDCYNILGGVDTVLPVDIYVPGCAARPEAIIDGVVKAGRSTG